MKKYLYIITIALISLLALFMIYRMINASSNEIRIWYSFLEKPFNESFTITASGSDKELSKETINLEDYKSSGS